MKVKELIEKLKEFNPESEVYCPRQTMEGFNNVMIVNNPITKIESGVSENKDVSFFNVFLSGDEH